MPIHVEKPEILPKVSVADTEYVSTVEQSTAHPGTPRCRITGTITTDEELLELVAAVHPALPRTAQLALCVTVATAATTDLHHSVDERLRGTRGVDEVLAHKVAEGVDRDRHVHQLFRLLRLTENRTRKAGWPGDLGHFDLLRGHTEVHDLQHILQLAHPLRHRSIEDLHHGSEFAKLVHGVPRNPLLWPRRLCQAGRPPPAKLFVVQTEEHRQGRRSRPELGRVLRSSRSPPPRQWPSFVLVRSGATTWPGPQRSTAAHVATTSAVVAACDAEQLLWKPAR